MNKDTRFSRWEDVLYFKDNLRNEDVAEIVAAGRKPYDSLTDGYEFSDPCLTVIDPKSGEPGAIMGVVRLDGPLDRIWLLGTDAIEKNAIPFAKQSKPILQYLFKETGANGFYNYSHHANTLHHKWLKWLGFKAIRRIQAGPHNEDFFEFVRLRGDA